MGVYTHRQKNLRHSPDKPPVFCLRPRRATSKVRIRPTEITGRGHELWEGGWGLRVSSEGFMLQALMFRDSCLRFEGFGCDTLPTGYGRCRVPWHTEWEAVEGVGDGG